MSSDDENNNEFDEVFDTGNILSEDEGEFVRMENLDESFVFEDSQVTSEDAASTSSSSAQSQSQSVGDLTLTLLLDGKLFVLEAVSGKGFCQLCKKASSSGYSIINNASNLTKHLAS